jgi:hypothetical protein
MRSPGAAWPPGHNHAVRGNVEGEPIETSRTGWLQTRKLSRWTDLTRRSQTVLTFRIPSLLVSPKGATCWRPGAASTGDGTPWRRAIRPPAGTTARWIQPPCVCSSASSPVCRSFGDWRLVQTQIRVSRTDHLRRPASGMRDSQPGLRLASRFVGIAAARSGRRK